MVSVMENLDLDNDGKIGAQDIEHNKLIAEFEKLDAQRDLAKTSLVGMILFTFFLFLPIVTVERVTALGDILGIFYIAQAGIVGAYMGVSAWMSRK
jgi:hypothetical protein